MRSGSGLSTNLTLVKLTVLFFAVSLFWGCNPEGFINRVSYNGVKYVNTCETFTQEVEKLIASNSDSSVLKVSQYDNAEFNYYYLEPGQFEIRKDTLLFRLADDINYPKYLDKGVAIHVNVNYKANPEVEDLEKEINGHIGILVVDRKYYVRNRKPFFIYKVPLNGAELYGKQLVMTFSIAKYDTKGERKKIFCNTIEAPIGTSFPSCCTARPWTNTNLRSVVDVPSITVKNEIYSYAGFTATMDVTFEEGSYSFPDSMMSDLVQAYINKYSGLDYEVSRIDIKGYASPGGDEQKNIELSDNRAKVIEEGLRKSNPEKVSITSIGMGEDWNRIKELTQSSSLEPDEKDQVLEIANKEIENDAKEAELRKVTFWDTLVEEVLIKARHTFVVMDFNYSGTNMTLERYGQREEISSPQLETIAKTTKKVSGYKEGANAQSELRTINELLAKKASANLYAMRATYALAEADLKKTIVDLEKAKELEPNNKTYDQIINGLKLSFIDTYDAEKLKDMYEEYNKLCQQNPGDRAIFFTRALIMEKIGYISGALIEYENLLEAKKPSVANLNNRGIAKLKTNMFTEAREDFESAISRNSSQAEPYFNLAVIAAYQGLTERTIEYLDKAISFKPEYKSLILNNPAFSVVSEDPGFDKYRN